VRDKLEELGQEELRIPNNPEGGRIGMSEQELQMVNDGKPIEAAKYVPWILDFLGHKLAKKKPPVVEEEEKEEEEEEVDDDTRKKREIEAKKKAIEEEKKRKEQEEKQKAKEERKRLREEALADGKDPFEMGIEESEEEPPEDLSIEQLVLKEDGEGKTPFVGGFILLNFPESEA